jgi:hypothetical protein
MIAIFSHASRRSYAGAAEMHSGPHLRAEPLCLLWQACMVDTTTIRDIWSGEDGSTLEYMSKGLLRTGKG